MSFIQRYSDIKRGGILFVGNTLGLSKIANLNQAGTLGSIGAFTSLDTTLKVNDFPFGTTLNYLQNGSSATLTLPVGSSVLYAELVWGGLFRSTVNNFATIYYTAAERPLSENTNTVQLAVVSNRLSIIKTVDKPVAIKGENLHYTSTITNTGTLLKTSLIFSDPIPADSTFVVGSVKIDGVTQAAYNPATGFPLADLPVGASTVVEFDVTVN